MLVLAPGPFLRLLPTLQCGVCCLPRLCFGLVCTDAPASLCLHGACTDNPDAASPHSHISKSLLPCKVPRSQVPGLGMWTFLETIIPLPHVLQVVKLGVKCKLSSNSQATPLSTLETKGERNKGHPAWQWEEGESLGQTMGRLFRVTRKHQRDVAFRTRLG